MRARSTLLLLLFVVACNATKVFEIDGAGGDCTSSCTSPCQCAHLLSPGDNNALTGGDTLRVIVPTLEIVQGEHFNMYSTGDPFTTMPAVIEGEDQQNWPVLHCGSPSWSIIYMDGNGASSSHDLVIRYLTFSWCDQRAIRVFEIDFILTLEHVRIENYSGNFGGGVYVYGTVGADVSLTKTELVIRDVSFSNMSLSGTNPADGVSLYVRNQRSVLIEDVIVDGSEGIANATSSQGGFMWASTFASFPYTPYLEIRNSVFRNNRAGQGGALYMALRNSVVTLDNVTFENNDCQGVSACGADLFITQNTTITLTDVRHDETYPVSTEPIRWSYASGASLIVESGTRLCPSGATTDAIYCANIPPELTLNTGSIVGGIDGSSPLLVGTCGAACVGNCPPPTPPPTPPATNSPTPPPTSYPSPPPTTYPTPPPTPGPTSHPTPPPTRYPTPPPTPPPTPGPTLKTPPPPTTFPTPSRAPTDSPSAIPSAAAPTVTSNDDGGDNDDDNDTVALGLNLGAFIAVVVIASVCVCCAVAVCCMIMRNRRRPTMRSPPTTSASSVRRRNASASNAKRHSGVPVANSYRGRNGFTNNNSISAESVRRSRRSRSTSAAVRGGGGGGGVGVGVGIGKPYNAPAQYVDVHGANTAAQRRNVGGGHYCNFQEIENHTDLQQRQPTYQSNSVTGMANPLHQIHNQYTLPPAGGGGGGGGRNYAQSSLGGVVGAGSSYDSPHRAGGENGSTVTRGSVESSERVDTETSQYDRIVAREAPPPGPPQYMTLHLHPPTNAAGNIQCGTTSTQWQLTSVSPAAQTSLIIDDWNWHRH